MNRQLLERVFERAQIKQRQGRNGMLDYVEGHSIIQRLNDAFEGAWSFEVLDHKIVEERDEILVLGKLSAEGVVKMQFGTTQITRERDSKKIVSIGDDLKAAATDALKKCATFLGVGLHLYGERSARPAGREGNGGPRQGTTARRANREPETRKPEPTNGQPEQPEGSNGNGRLTNAQHSAILTIAKRRGLSQIELNQESLNRYGAQVPYLTSQSAADLIQHLQSPAQQPTQ
ncbi:Rad52/Rad22 family DNA repair protein [Candidatus Methylomirabilis sp.]|uniref:RAD52 family DNA repair protein n=1 Tax=Candidatus Methylomirabilis tolerans TaxID=3123416 RepID=A0AAJ1EIV8_9BACT|nr:RAD52 family DNA repair protein [Candidatus Methylomirabilis sp.]